VDMNVNYIHETSHIKPSFMGYKNKEHKGNLTYSIQLYTYN